MYDDILIPTDGKDGSTVAIEHGVDLAARHDARVHGLYVVDEDVFEHYAAMDAIENAEAALADLGEDALYQLAAAADRENLDVETVEVRGKPHEAILDYATDHDIDCIVMGEGQHTEEYRRLLGSCTERVVRLSDVPVLVVKA
ncbi:universal stress protein [Haloarchaeobius sp. HME9146]|uniref:universal stress protein n=1 Tax=Haloarchaeobius sp. HME9146 TaxID=2978732 RepID=UPI0021BF6DC6|nr:universal stress protein [Haloarchaeobius sp. HME9146]MCT9095527.1 universal stress protein [Haloarchaeobius sp. HME9146]